LAARHRGTHPELRGEVEYLGVAGARLLRIESREVRRHLALESEDPGLVPPLLVLAGQLQGVGRNNSIQRSGCMLIHRMQAPEHRPTNDPSGWVGVGRRS
jgi:hypothetical protein